MEEIQTSAEYLANLCLESEGPKGYTDRDLMNATLIMSHFLIDTIWYENQHLTQEAREELAQTTGEALRELIRVSCGKDMHLIAKNL